MTQLTANQSAQLTASEVRNLPAEEARKLAQSFKLKGAWNARKVELHNMLISYFASQEVSPEVEQEPTPEVESEIAEVQSEVEHLEACLAVLVSDPLAEPAFNYQPTSGNFEAPVQIAGLLESKQAKKARQKSAKKQPKVISELAFVTEAQLEFLRANTQTTSASCSDPGRLVVNRRLIRQLIEDVHGQHVSEKVFNQLVVLASRKLPRQPMTIQSASRFKYLLAEVKPGQLFSPAELILDHLLAHPELIKQAAQAYQTAAETGLECINEWLNSKAN